MSKSYVQNSQENHFIIQMWSSCDFKVTLGTPVNYGHCKWGNKEIREHLINQETTVLPLWLKGSNTRIEDTKFKWKKKYLCIYSKRSGFKKKKKGVQPSASNYNVSGNCICSKSTQNQDILENDSNRDTSCTTPLP